MENNLKVGSEFNKVISNKVAGKADVLVCGGGTAGCVAAIAAARSGASVILLEQEYYLGGMMSEGNAGLTKFIMHAKDARTQAKIIKMLRKDPSKVQLVGGIPMEITHKLIEKKAAVGTAGTAASYVYTDSQEFKILLYDMMMQAGVRVLLHAFICDILMENNRINGVVIETKMGRQAYLGKCIIDSTGDGDVAAMAGVPFVVGVSPEDAVFKQRLCKLGELSRIGSMFRIGGVNFNRYITYLENNPEAFDIQRVGLMTYEEFIEAYKDGEMIIGKGVTGSGRKFQIYNYPHPDIMIGCISIENPRNGLDIEELTRAEYEVMIAAKNYVTELRKSVPGFEKAFVLDTPQAGVRETRHILGEYKLNVMDIVSQREFNDTIGKGCHPIDIKPLPKEAEDMKKCDIWYFNLPYRSLVAKNVINLLLAGRCISSTREAAGCTRPTVPCMVSGEAAGTAAAMFVKENVPKVRDVDIKKLRMKLKKQGVIL